MHTELIQLDRGRAAQLYRDYKKAVYYDKPLTEVDAEVMQAYRLIAKGKMIIRALESIRQAGLTRDFLPKLAIAPATAPKVFLTRYHDGQMQMSPTERFARGRKRNTFAFRENTFVFPADSFPLTWDRKGRSQRSEHSAQVPPVPLSLKPKRGLASYFILWEANWQPEPARDPYLLRRIGRADLWVVLAHWELTEVERAALSTRV
jgi:hypothetical protein